MRTLVGLLAITIVTSGCTRECGPETRYTRATAGIDDPEQVRVGQVHFSMREERGESIARELSVTLNGPGYQPASPLRGHIDGARLVNTSGEILFTLRVTDSPPEVLVIAIVRTESSITATRFEAIRQDLIAGRVVVELTTDLPGMELIRIPMPRADTGDFARGGCLNYPG